MAGTVDTHRKTDYKNVNPDLAVLAAVTLTPDQTVIECSAATATDNYTITLPPVALCAGKIFTIVATSIANAKTVTLSAADGRTTISEALDETDDAIVIFSNGREWFPLFNNLSA